MDERWDKASNAVQEGLRSLSGLKVAWFYLDEDFGGQTASYADESVTIDLDETARWMAKLKDDAFTFTDGADGYAVAWIGDRIPTRFLR